LRSFDYSVIYCGADDGETTELTILSVASLAELHCGSGHMPTLVSTAPTGRAALERTSHLVRISAVAPARRAHQERVWSLRMINCLWMKPKRTSPNDFSKAAITLKTVNEGWSAYEIGYDVSIF